jgi:hypothetical protein
MRASSVISALTSRIRHSQVFAYRAAHSLLTLPGLPVGVNIVDWPTLFFAQHSPNIAVDL